MIPLAVVLAHLESLAHGSSQLQLGHVGSQAKVEHGLVGYCKCAETVEHCSAGHIDKQKLMVSARNG